MKRAYLFQSTLSQLVRASDNVIQVDAQLFTYLDNLLSGDYCYLVLGCEVIKVLGTANPNLLLVKRRIEGGEPITWQIGTSLSYILTKSELMDATTYVGYSLSISGGLNGLSYPLAIYSIGGLDLYQIEGQFTLYDIPQNMGCDASTNPADIPIEYEKARKVDSGYRVTSSGNYRRYM